jgi:hypothetical protein
MKTYQAIEFLRLILSTKEDLEALKSLIDERKQNLMFCQSEKDCCVRAEKAEPKPEDQAPTPEELEAFFGGLKTMLNEDNHSI